MTSSVPLINAVAQNTVDFNNQTPSNAGGLFRYKIKNIGAPTGGSYSLLPSDLNSVLIFSGDVTLYADLNSFGGSGPPVGSEVFFYSSGVTSVGQIQVVAQNCILTAENGPFLQSLSDTGRLIYMGLDNIGSKTWVFASKNYNFQVIDFTNCCVEEAQYAWQIALPGASYDSSFKAYVDASFSYPYNGEVYFTIIYLTM